MAACGLWHKYMYDARMLRMDDDGECWGFKTDWGWRTYVTLWRRGPEQSHLGLCPGWAYETARASQIVYQNARTAPMSELL